MLCGTTILHTYVLTKRCLELEVWDKFALTESIHNRVHFTIFLAHAISDKFAVFLSTNKFLAPRSRLIVVCFVL